MGTDIRTTASTKAPVRSRRAELLARIALVAIAVAANDLSAWLVLPLTTLAVVVTAEWVVRRRQRGVIDAVATAAAGIVITAVLLGLLLNLLPTGLTPASWSLGGGLVALVVLCLGAIAPVPRSVWAQSAPHPAAPRSDGKSFGPGTLMNGICALLAVLVVAGALTLSANSASANRTAPLELAATTAGTQVEVTINSGTSEGPFDLLLVNGATTTTVASDLKVTETNSLVVLVTIAPTGRTLLQLVPAGGTEPLRELIFDYGVLTSVPAQ